MARGRRDGYIDGSGDDEVVLRVHYRIDDPDRHDVTDIGSAYARRVLKRLDRADIDVSPPPKRDLQARLEIDEAI